MGHLPLGLATGCSVIFWPLLLFTASPFFVLSNFLHSAQFLVFNQFGVVCSA